MQGAVACGHKFSVFVSEEGHAYACGSNEFGELGFGAGKQTVFVPKRIGRLYQEQISLVSCGSNFAVCMDTSGQVYTFAHKAEMNRF